MSLSLKPGVRVFGLRPEILIALQVAEGAYRDAGFNLTVTCGMDGKHSNASLHYTGCAVDLRTRDVPSDKLEPLRKTIQERLPTDFDVVLEGDHIHLEYQPKQPYGG